MNSNSTTIDTVNTDFQKYLESISVQDDIAGYVAREALEHDDPISFFHNLSQHGCASGMVSDLIYYSNTHAFFEIYYDEIQELKDEWEYGCCEPLRIE